MPDFSMGSAIATLVNVVAREQDCRELLGGEELLEVEVAAVGHARRSPVGCVF